MEATRCKTDNTSIGRRTLPHQLRIASSTLPNDRYRHTAKNPAIITNFTSHRHEHLTDSAPPASWRFLRQPFKLIDDID
ncbi:MAG: hypothetical protein KAY57_02615 [Neisseria sp.]|nr:hypothetical protein [Neisseria sp.]